VLTGKALDAIETINSGLFVIQLTGNKALFAVSYLARAHAELGHFDDAVRYIDQAIIAVETTNERWWEAHIYRVAGEIALARKSNTAKAETYFEQALAVARAQRTKSWELRAATSMARLWRDQGKRDEARELLAPVYGWFAEGFDTLDLKEAKALLDDLAA
jgi:predicted ATPase